MAADLLTALTVILAAMGIGAILEYVRHAIHYGHRGQR